MSISCFTICCHHFVVLVQCVSYTVGHVACKVISRLELYSLWIAVVNSFSIAELLKSYSYCGTLNILELIEHIERIENVEY